MHFFLQIWKFFCNFVGGYELMKRPYSCKIITNMKRFFNFLLVATVCLTAICTTSCKQNNPSTPDEQLTAKIIGKWKIATTTMDYYDGDKLITSKTADYPISYVDVFNADGTWENYWSATCDDPSDPANAKKLLFYAKGTFSIKDSVLTTTYSIDNTYGEELAGFEYSYTIISLTESTLSHLSDGEDEGKLIKITTNCKKLK